jgi:hypothetical protein
LNYNNKNYDSLTINDDPYIKIHWVTFLSISLLSDAIIIILMVQIIKIYINIIPKRKKYIILLEAYSSIVAAQLQFLIISLERKAKIQQQHQIHVNISPKY